jgi:hypothetical protein
MNLASGASRVGFQPRHEVRAGIDLAEQLKQGARAEDGDAVGEVAQAFETQGGSGVDRRPRHD